MSNMHRIIDIDYGRNHAQREYTREYVHAIMDAYVLVGGLTFETDNVFILYKDLGDSRVEFHCINGGTGAELTSAINSLLKQLASEFSAAFTYYDNPRVNDLVKYLAFFATVVKIDDGLDRTYELTFDLRS